MQEAAGLAIASPDNPSDLLASLDEAYKAQLTQGQGERGRVPPPQGQIEPARNTWPSPEAHAGPQVRPGEARPSL